MKYLIVSLLIFIGCSKKDVLPYQFVGIKCLELDTDCVDIEQQKILRTPILKTKIKRTILQMDGFSVVYEDDTQKNLNKMLKDFPHREYIHVQNNKIFYQSIEHNEFSIRFTIKNNLTAEENFKRCIDFSRKCDKEEFDLQTKNIEIQNSKLAVIRNREKNAKKIYESLRWLPIFDQLFIYDKEGKKIKTINSKTLTFQQDFDDIKNQFIYNKDLIKFTIGWIKRSDIAPENIFINLKNVLPELSKLHYELRCLNKKNLELNKQDSRLVEKFIKAQIRSLEIAHESLSSRPLAGYDKLKKALKNYQCPK